MKRRTALLALASPLVTPLSFAATLPSGVIPATKRMDVAFDAVRGVVLISGDTEVKRYELSTGRFLTPIVLGGHTAGMDISADGNWLAVANTARGARQLFIDLVNLNTRAHTRIPFNREYGEGGSYAVAFDAAGQVLVTSLYEGSGWTPLRKYDPVSKTTLSLGDVRGGSMVSPSATHFHVAVTENDISSGPYGRYTTGNMHYSSSTDTNWFTYEIAISPHGQQIVVPTYGGTFVDDTRTVLPSVGDYAGQQPIGAAYAPTGDRVYFPFAGTTEIRVYKASTMTPLRSIAVPAAFSGNGNWAFQQGRIKVAADNSVLLCTVSGGVFFKRLK